MQKKREARADTIKRNSNHEDLNFKKRTFKRGEMSITCSIITVSDKGYRGEREDITGGVIEKMLAEYGFHIAGRSVVPDEKPLIKDAIVNACDTLRCDIVFTNGGTGLSPRDITPDVTKSLLDYEIQGIPEAMRHSGLKETPFAMLSRAVAGVRGSSIVINLPGSVKGARESLGAIIRVLEHAVSKLQGSTEECGKE